MTDAKPMTATHCSEQRLHDMRADVERGVSPTLADISALLHDHDALRAENARLAAVVERLPLSADGVRITPGMSVWTPKGMFSGTAVREHTPVLVGDEDMLGEVEEYLWTWYAKSCYSTRAAAEAARRAPDAGERGGG